jgi:hypothetical protein
MLLYYAMGGGLGHLSRASAFLSMNKIKKFRVITASPFALKLFKRSELFMIPRELEKHPELLKQSMQDILYHIEPAIFVIDTFSHGILGELNHIDWKKISLYYISRRVKWNRYQAKVISEISFKKTFVLEPPEEEHKDFIKKVSFEILDYDLDYPNHKIDKKNKLVVNSANEKWFVVHSGPAEEVDSLISLAHRHAAGTNPEPELMVISQVTPGVGVTWLTDVCPAHGYFQFASRLYTGCGFNIMKQAEKFKIPHDFIPFDRKYDDQFWRAERAKKNG